MIVNCYLIQCKYCSDDLICTQQEITLNEFHVCDGGCDEGWMMQGTENLDRINETPPGIMHGVASNWLEGVTPIMIEDAEDA